MEFIGIDFGSFKTTIASSKENGKILGDEQGKRSIPTILELTTPIRKFGNSITGEHEQSINLRYRNFRDNLSFTDNCKVYLMYMKYLDRLIKVNTKGAPSICISIPSYFKYSDRKFLLDVTKLCNMKVERFFNDISSIGMFACLRREKIPEKFLIFDFGHTKTEVGIFTYEKFKFTPVYIRNIKIGAVDFDNKLITLIMKKYKLEDKKIIRENILRHLEKLKTVLNSSETANIQIYIDESPINVQITQEEYSMVCKEEIDSLSVFINDVIKESEYSGVIEVTGGNSSSFLIRNLLKVDNQSTLDLTESCAIGTALGMACTIVSNKFKMNDVIGRNISTKLEGTKNKQTEIFTSLDLVESIKTLTYKRKESFTLEFFDDNENISKLEIKKEKTEEPESVKILVQINKFGILEIKSVKIDDKDLDYKYTEFEMSDDQKEELIKSEEKYRLLETNIEKIGHMRNELETMVMGLLEVQGIFNDEDHEKVRTIAMDLFDIPSVSEIEEEVKIRNDVIKQLDFIIKKLEDLESSIRKDIEDMKCVINEYKERFTKKCTPSYFKLQGLSYKLEDANKKMKFDLFNIQSFDGSLIDNIKEELKVCLIKADEELKKIKEEELRKETEEKNKNKQEDEVEKDLKKDSEEKMEETKDDNESKENK